jgi:hypothetical protein
MTASNTTRAPPTPAAIRLRANHDRNTVGAEVLTPLIAAPLKVVFMVSRLGATRGSEDSLRG